MSTEKKNLASKIKAHFAEKKEEYIKFGYYTLGVCAATGVTIIMMKIGQKQIDAEWAAAALRGTSKLGGDVLTLADREGNFHWFAAVAPTEI